VRNQLGVEMRDVEEEFERFGECHEVDWLGVFLGRTTGFVSIASGVASDGGVDVDCKGVGGDEEGVVEGGVVGCEEEDTSEKEFGVDVFALGEVSIRLEAYVCREVYVELVGGLRTMALVYEHLARPRHQEQGVG